MYMYFLYMQLRSNKYMYIYAMHSLKNADLNRIQSANNDFNG